MRYIAKPIEVEAIQWLGNNEQEIYDFCGNRAHCMPRSSYMVISTLAGKLYYVVPGNYIVRDINSKDYSVYQAQQFQDMYEEENEDGIECGNQ